MTRATHLFAVRLIVIGVSVTLSTCLAHAASRRDSSHAPRPKRQALQIPGRSVSPRRFRAGAPVVTVRATRVRTAGGDIVVLPRGRRLIYYSDQMTRECIVTLPNGTRGWIPWKDIAPIQR